MKKTAILAVMLLAVSAHAGNDDRAPELDNAIIEAIRGISESREFPAIVSIEGSGAVEQHKDDRNGAKKKHPCSVKLDLDQTLLARLEEGRFLEVVEEILLAACKGVGSCDFESDFDDVSRQTIGSLGLTGHEGEMFRNTVQHTIEGHSDEHEPSRDTIPIELAERETVTLQELALSIAVPSAAG